MRVTLAGYLTDYKGRVLLRRPSARSLEPVTCALQAGEEPAATLARAFRAATGYFVLPIRLVGVYYARDGELTLSYRCTLRGGELAPPAGQPPAGFFDAQPPPRGLSTAQARQLDDALHHEGGPARLARAAEGLVARLGIGPARAKSGPGVEWVATARLIAAAGGRILWTRAAATDLWRLPTRLVAPGDAPWQTAAALQRALGLGQGDPPALRLITLAADLLEMNFVFLVTYEGNALAPTADTDVTLAAVDVGQTGFDAADTAVAAEVLAAPPGTVARRGPAGAAQS